MDKKLIAVNATFSDSGKVIPTRLIWDDLHSYDIDRVLDMRRAASLKAGGIGIRYTCMVCGKQVYLFRDEDQWYMEVDG